MTHTPSLRTSALSLSRGSRRRQSIVLMTLAMLMTAALFAGSMMPPAYKNLLHTRGRFHSWMHVVTFGAVAFVATRSTRSTPVRFLVFAGALFFGFAVEVLEHFQYHCSLEWRDVLADSIGITVATLLALLLERPA